MSWFDSIKQWFQSLKNINWLEIGENRFDSTKDWFEILKNINWLEIGDHWFNRAKDWFREIFETAGKNGVFKKYAVIGGIGLAAVVVVMLFYKCLKCCCACMCGRRRRGRTMKAPGRDGLMIYRDPFERNPRDYFRGLRNQEPWNDELV